MKPIGIAVIGYGAIGKVHARVVKELESEGLAKLIWIVDTKSEIAEEAGKTFGIKYSTSIIDPLKDPEVDIVSICTPSYLHSTQAIQAFEYGKDVIVEKPMAVSIIGAKEMIKRAERYGRRLGVVFQNRYAPDVKRLKQEIDKGELGKLFLGEVEVKWYRDEITYYLKDETARSWRGMWFTEGGGVMSNQGIHHIDLLIWFMGDVDSVAGFIANLTHPSIDVEDTAVASLKFKSGALGSIVQTVSTVPQTHQYWKIRVYGTEGQAELTNGNLTLFLTRSGKKIEFKSETHSETIMVPGALHKELYRDFLRAYIEGKPFPIDGYEGYKSLEVLKAVYMSYQLKSFVKLPIEINILI